MLDRYRLAAKIQTLGKDGAALSEREPGVGYRPRGASLICPNQFSLSLNNETMIRITIWPPDTGKSHTYLASQRHLTCLSDQKLRLGVQFAATGDPLPVPTQPARKRPINELDAVCGAHAMMGELRHKSLRPGAGIKI